MRKSTAESMRFSKVLLCAALVSCLAAGLVELGFTWVPGTSFGVWLQSALVVLGMWGLMASALALAEHVAGWAAFGFGKTGHGVEMYATRAGLWWQQRFSREDALRGAAMFSWIVAVGTLIALTLAFGAWLTKNTQGRFLMVVTLVGAQAFFFLVALLVRRALGRLLQALAGSGLGSRRVVRIALSLWTQLLGLALGLLAAGLYLLARQFQLLADTDALALGVPLAAVVLHIPLLMWSCGRRQLPLVRRLPLWGWWAGVVVVSLGLAWVGAQSPKALHLVKTHSWTSKYVLSLLEKASDVDSDGFSAFPALVDCAPLDPSRNPLSPDIPGNGQDENCDGRDSSPGQETAAGNASRTPGATSYLASEIGGRKPDLILVTVDAMRADHLGFMGYDRETSLELDRLAASGTVFTAAFSQDSGTGPSIWSLMAGTTPFQARLQDGKGFPMNLAADQPALAEVLNEAGYATHARVCGSMFAKKRWTIGRGFKEFKEVCKTAKSDSAEAVLKKAEITLRTLRKAKQPFFLWVHFFDPHHPYQAHPEYPFGDEALDRYDSEIAYATKSAASLIKLATSGNRPAYVFLAADHGENFGQHGHSHHARTLYREVTHVPLVAWGPGVKAQRVESAVALNDLHPTLLELAGTTNPESTMVSLVPFMAGASPGGQRIVFQENSFSRPVQHVKGAVWGDYHLLWNLSTGTRELYHWREDPAESENLAEQDLPEEAVLADAISTLLQSSVLPDSLK